jgi:hypothetical protein
MTEERKVAILFAATLLAARRLIDMDQDKPNMAKGFLCCLHTGTDRCAMTCGCEVIYSQDRLDVLLSQLGKPTTRIVCVAIGALRNSLPACDFSLETVGHRARFYLASVVFRNSLVGKASKTSFFRTSDSWMPEYRLRFRLV